MPIACGGFHWTEIYSVNIALLDQQHERLFETVNKLDVALAAGEGNAAVETVLNELFDYAFDHFSAEESLMKAHAFPGLPTHRAEHDIFREKVATFREEYRAAKPGVAVSLLLFLQPWLRQHVLKTDKQYSAFLNARGVR